MPVFWKVTRSGLEGTSTYCVPLCGKHYKKYCPRTLCYPIAGTVTKVLETSRKVWHG